MNDRERACRVMTQSRRSAGDSLEDDMAAEFAAVRAPLEQRIAQLEAALRKVMMHASGHLTDPLLTINREASAALFNEKREK